MRTTTETPTRDAKIVQYLGEALGNEKRLETELQAHIGMTTRAPYKRRLRQHLAETKRHATHLSRRIKQLGGTSDPVPGPLVDAAGALLGGAHKATALAQAPLYALRGTGEAERQLKNAKTEYTEEARKLKLEGEVLLRVLFTAGGEPRVLEVVRGLGHGLDETAIRAGEPPARRGEFEEHDETR